MNYFRQDRLLCRPLERFHQVRRNSNFQLLKPLFKNLFELAKKELIRIRDWHVNEYSKQFVAESRDRSSKTRASLIRVEYINQLNASIAMMIPPFGLHP